MLETREGCLFFFFPMLRKSRNEFVIVKTVFALAKIFDFEFSISHGTSFVSCLTCATSA